eukprot:5817846-Amphidinium_carterae.1
MQNACKWNAKQQRELLRRRGPLDSCYEHPHPTLRKQLLCVKTQAHTTGLRLYRELTDALRVLQSVIFQLRRCKSLGGDAAKAGQQALETSEEGRKRFIEVLRSVEVTLREQSDDARKVVHTAKANLPGSASCSIFQADSLSLLCIRRSSGCSEVRFWRGADCKRSRDIGKGE